MSYPSPLSAVAMATAMFAASLCGCSPTHPTTPDEFIATFSHAYESGDTETLSSLCYWGEIPKEVRKASLQFMCAFAGQHKVVSVECALYEEKFPASLVENPREARYTLEPKYWFSVQTEGNEGFEGTKSYASFEGALGYAQGKLYFCGPSVTGNRSRFP